VATIVAMADRGQKKTVRERRLHRLAMQIAVQLPEHEADALLVLIYARELLKASLG
jgi:hypothetical protein